VLVALSGTSLLKFESCGHGYGRSECMNTKEEQRDLNL
jgi:hypothetical protein